MTENEFLDQPRSPLRARNCLGVPTEPRTGRRAQAKSQGPQLKCSCARSYRPLSGNGFRPSTVDGLPGCAISPEMVRSVNQILLGRAAIAFEKFCRRIGASKHFQLVTEERHFLRMVKTFHLMAV